ncbi:hypothetical protein BJ912DRAFT_1039303 [Pholiota molesta]|nr:hypothetical protein BJ912DRAFT_1039303 [Pholiota molesta]
MTASQPANIRLAGDAAISVIAGMEASATSHSQALRINFARHSMYDPNCQDPVHGAEDGWKMGDWYESKEALQLLTCPRTVLKVGLDTDSRWFSPVPSLYLCSLGKSYTLQKYCVHNERTINHGKHVARKILMPINEEVLRTVAEEKTDARLICTCRQTELVQGPPRSDEGYTGTNANPRRSASNVTGAQEEEKQQKTVLGHGYQRPEHTAALGTQLGGSQSGEIMYVPASPAHGQAQEGAQHEGRAVPPRNGKAGADVGWPLARTITEKSPGSHIYTLSWIYGEESEDPRYPAHGGDSHEIRELPQRSRIASYRACVRDAEATEGDHSLVGARQRVPRSNNKNIMISECSVVRSRTVGKKLPITDFLTVIDDEVGIETARKRSAERMLLKRSYLQTTAYRNK